MKKILIALFLMFVLIVSVSAFWPFTKASLSPPTFPSKTLTCEGIDADQKTDVAGTIKYTWKQGVVSRTGFKGDSCEGTSQIIEIYCSGKKPKYIVKEYDSTLYKCEAITITAFEQQINSAKLVALSTTPTPTPGELSCTDSDADDSNEGLAPKIGGIVYGTDSQGDFVEADRCGENNQLIEMSCKEETYTSSKIKCKGDVAGKCLPKEIEVNGRTYTSATCNPEPLSCTENGLVVTAIIDTMGTSNVKIDECEGKKLTDYSCDSSNPGKIIKTQITCENGCNPLTSSCLVEAICSDSDGGRNFDNVGTITTPYAMGISDFCYSDKGLVEFYCKDNKASSSVDKTIYLQKKNCKNGCLNGKCVARQTEGVSQPLEQ